jgi:DNA-binding transcriptional regulator YiaG
MRNRATDTCPLTKEILEARRLPPPLVARAIRCAAGVSQAQLARELGVRRVTVARWEKVGAAWSRRPRGELRRRYTELLEELQREVLSP